MSAAVDLLTELGLALGCTTPAGSGQRSAVSDQPLCASADSRKLKAESCPITVCLSRTLMERERAYYAEACERGIEHYQGRFKIANRARSRRRREERRRRAGLSCAAAG